MVRRFSASEKCSWQVGLCKCIRPLLEHSALRAMMECAAPCSSLNRQSRETVLLQRFFRAPGLTVVPSHYSPADLAGFEKGENLDQPAVVAGLQM
jgi:hypothetical protein